MGQDASWRDREGIPEGAAPLRASLADPRKWLEDQCRLAQMPNFMEATLASLRANIGVAGQRDVLVDQLPRLRMPTLIVWGVEDRVFPYWQEKLQEKGSPMTTVHLKPVEEQVVALMGASSGIGRETALRFAERGAKVVVSARGEEGLDSLAEEIRRGNGEATPVVADTSEYEQVKAVADRAVEEYGRLDCWVHLAAVGLFATFEQTTPEEFERVIDVNLMGQVYGAMAALPHLKREGRGALIHISSVEAKRSFPFHSAYGASKHGIDGFLEALRVELKREGWPISVTQVMPGTINTPFFDKGRTKLGVKPVGVPPIYEPQTVANVILYAAEHPTRDLVCGGAAQALILNQRLSPRMLDAILATRTGFSPQKTKEPRSEEDPDNLYGPIQGHDTAKNGFRAFSRSLYNWLQMHPTLRRGAAAGTALGLLVALRRSS